MWVCVQCVYSVCTVFMCVCVRSLQSQKLVEEHFTTTPSTKVTTTTTTERCSLVLAFLADTLLLFVFNCTLGAPDMVNGLHELRVPVANASDSGIFITKTIPQPS